MVALWNPTQDILNDEMLKGTYVASDVKLVVTQFVLAM